MSDEGTDVALVTGGTGVIGGAVARKLAERGDRVLLVGRDADRGSSLAAELRDGTPGDAAFLRVDLADRAAVRELAATVREEGRLDRFVAAAGTFREARETTPDGIEYTLAVNYLSTYLLCHELVPLALETAPGDGGDAAMGAGPDPVRVVALTAAVSDRQIDLDDLQSATDYELQVAYARSKRCLTSFAVELADRLPDGVAVDALHPGFVPEGRSREQLPWFVRGPYRVLSALSVGDGADTAADRVVEVATGGSGATGRYIEGGERADVPAFAADEAARGELWRRSAELVDVDPDWP